MKVSFNWNPYEINELQSKLSRLNIIRFDAVVKKQATQILNRARQEGGTPVDTGELRKSSKIAGSGYDTEVGYTASYAPHVEYGHRTRNGGYVQGQHFLRANVEVQRPIYKEDLIKAINKELKS